MLCNFKKGWLGILAQLVEMQCLYGSRLESRLPVVLFFLTDCYKVNQRTCGELCEPVCVGEAEEE